MIIKHHFRIVNTVTRANKQEIHFFLIKNLKKNRYVSTPSQSTIQINRRVQKIHSKFEDTLKLKFCCVSYVIHIYSN